MKYTAHYIVAAREYMRPDQLSGGSQSKFFLFFIKRKIRVYFDLFRTYLSRFD